ncbi:MAG: peptidylprolyl isomerase [Gemmatimonadales bacterium]|nr:peptidylprolyl isomerase [Gemmatimonadales bacterium]NIN11163.1 peptidylprolyl isomerase [Gemmatimonadales bacterium]NIN49762.1 peptidylprolyl isomerase [Gemmatimonadales bacterium]NIP07226.1 peptidylprolyl isomerase [Gemmatimonadales bacterium]NIR00439.1 peptidylprolyl isomerase [Gemmatimonadales bacterium]
MQGDTVLVHYTGMLDDGTVFDSSIDRDPIKFTIGDQTVIRGVEDAVVGLRVGEKKKVVIGPEDAYGPHLKDKVAVVDRSQLPDDLEPRTGTILKGRSPKGTIMLTITDVTEDQVTLDANHPLAGKQLTFELEIMEISRP